MHTFSRRPAAVKRVEYLLTSSFRPTYRFALALRWTGVEHMEIHSTVGENPCLEEEEKMFTNDWESDVR